MYLAGLHLCNALMPLHGLIRARIRSVYKYMIFHLMTQE